MSEDKAYEDGYHDGFEDGRYVASRKHLIQIDQLEAENRELKELTRDLMDEFRGFGLDFSRRWHEHYEKLLEFGIDVR